MNERIRELELQCFVFSEQTNKRIFDREKFAELIVRECMNLTEGCRDKYLNSAPYKIAKHFGVE